MKTLSALSAAALIAAAPVVFAQGASGTAPGFQHKASRAHHRGISGYDPQREMPIAGSKKGYPAAFGYTPSTRPDREIETSRQAGGGGGGGGGGM